MRESDIDLIDLRTALTYHPITGEFTWSRPKGRQQRGAAAGTKLATGYIAIRFDGVRYLAHRLAWIYTTGQWPVGEIDHINGIRDDNRISNLRDVTRSENQQNQRLAKVTSKTGFLGVSRADASCGYRARIFTSGREQHLGTFPTAEDAHLAYVEAKRRFHTGGVI